MFPTLHHAVRTLGSSGSSRVVLRNRSRMIICAVVCCCWGGQGCRAVQLWRRSFWSFFRTSKLAPAELRIDGEASGAFSERANWHRQNSELIFVHCSGPFIGPCRQAPFSTGSTRRYPLATIDLPTYASTIPSVLPSDPPMPLLPCLTLLTLTKPFGLGRYQKRGENRSGFQGSSHLQYLNISLRVMPFLNPFRGSHWTENCSVETLSFFSKKLYPIIECLSVCFRFLL
jgi:hypothetical protein